MLFAIQPAGAQTENDYDSNDNRLIEIDSMAKLNAIRHDLTGAGTATHATYTAAFPNPASGQCPTSCQGYELTADLTFDSDGDGDVDANDHSGLYWDSGAGWTPIGSDASASARWQARFNGNGHTIDRLFINRSSTDQGLFGALHSTARVEKVGVTNANVTASNYVGILAGDSYGPIYGAYTTGQVTGAQEVGGLVGYLDAFGGDLGSVKASYSTAAVSGTGSSPFNIGGLVGQAQSSTVTASYATGAVSSSGTLDAGGLVGDTQEAQAVITASYSTGVVSSGGAAGGLLGRRHGANSVVNSYYDRQRSGRSDTGKGDPKTTRELQTPTDYEGIYAGWNVDVAGDSNPDDPWDFGTNRHYPALKIDFDGDGIATCHEFGPQRCYTPPAPPPYNWRTDHPESYQNARHNITAACAVRTTGPGDEAITTSTLTFDLAEYTRPITLALSLWDKTHFRSLQSLGLNMPALQRDGQMATVEVVTDPARTRFRLDGPYGLNLVLGYADCHTDDS